MAATAVPDFAPVAARLHPNCLIEQPAALPYGGAWRGHRGAEAWMRSFRATFSRSHVHATARATGRRTDWPLLQQIEVGDGSIVTLQPFHWDIASMLSALAVRD